MTFFTEANKNARTIPVSGAATGPLVGFFESFEVAYEAQQRTASLYGLEYYMQEADSAQQRKLRARGIEDVPVFGDDDQREDQAFFPQSDFMSLARAANGEVTDERFANKMRAYDERINAIRTQNPDLDLKTSKEMFEDVKTKAQEVERTEATNRRTWGGTFGSLAGGMIGSMDMRTDPLNFATLGVGGIGKTVFTRVASQVGAQGVIEGINQVTGVQESRRLMGLSSGFMDGASRVAMTAVGAGVLQGAGEAVIAGVRGAGRLFRGSAPNDLPPPDLNAPPAPAQGRQAAPPDPQAAALQTGGVQAYNRILAEQAPLSGIRTAEPRALADLDDMTRQLSDWAGGDPAKAVPRTLQASFYPGADALPRVDVSAALQSNARAIESNARYQAARAVDPVAFDKFEKLTQKRDDYRRFIDELSADRDADMDVTLRGMEAKIQALEVQHRTTQGKTNKLRLREEIASVKRDRDALMGSRKETPDLAEVRRALVKTDEQMRDFAPLIGRAYARADGRWNETDAEVEAVWNAYSEGRTQPDPPQSVLPDYDTAMLSLSDRAPVLQQAHKVQQGATSADTAVNVIAEQRKVMDEALDAFDASLSGLLGRAEGNKLRVDGTDIEFDLDADRIFVPNETGGGGREVSIREMLDENNKAKQETEAISTCSIR